MTMTIDIYYFYALIAANAVLLGVACYTFVRFEKRCRDIEDFWESPTGNAVSDDYKTDAQLRIVRRLERRIGQLQRSIKVLEINRPAPPGPAVVERTLPIENAVRMTQSGASIDDITKSCGLNIGEARLMQKLHRRSHALAAQGNCNG